MDNFSILILVLLILSIANNLIMYQKCYISRNLPSYDPKLNSTVGFYPINFYYSLSPVQTSETSEETKYYTSNNLLDDFKNTLVNFQKKYPNSCFVTLGNPSDDDYIKINKLEENNVSSKTTSEIGSDNN